VAIKKLTIQGNLETYDTQDEEKKTNKKQRNMRWKLLYASKHK